MISFNLIPIIIIRNDTKQTNNNETIDIYKHKIDEIKLKLNETKKLVKTYQLK